MTLSVGKVLEERGWLQCTVIDKGCGLPLLYNGTLIDVDADSVAQYDFVLVVATQSCNIANKDVNTVQLNIGYHIDNKDKSREFNKHPRELDTSYYSLKTDEGAIEQNIRININEKVFIPKELLLEIEVAGDLFIQDYEKSSYVDWLGAHYTKPALPTHFNDQIAAVKRKNSKKFRKKEKSLSADFLGVYVRIHPNRDLVDNEQYKVQLLGLVKPGADIDVAGQSLGNYSTILSDAGMNVTHAARYSTKVSVAALQDFQRIYLDELSYSEETEELPPDVSPGLF